MNLKQISDLQIDYLDWHKRRLNEAMVFFSRNNPLAPALFINLFRFCWLRHEIHPAWQKALLAHIGLGTTTRGVELLLESDDTTSYLYSLLEYWSEQPIESPNSCQQSQQWLAAYGKGAGSKVLTAILARWQKLGLFANSYLHGVRQIQAAQKITAAGVGGVEDRQRVALLDSLPDSLTGSDPFTKIAVIPHMACPQSCRHCMFVWRPLLKNLPDPGLIFRHLNKKTHNILFTGGDLSKKLGEYSRAIREMGNVAVFAILLNGTLAESKEAAEDFFVEIRQAIRGRPAHFRPAQATVQISFDEYHQEIVADKKGRLSERIPVANIVNLLVASLAFPEIQFVLLHKQNRLNFSQNLFKAGVFARLARELAARDLAIDNINWQTSPRAKADPVNPAKKGGIIRDVFFTVNGFAKQPIHMMSSTIDAYGRAALLDESEYINERDYMEQILASNSMHNERFDVDPMVWYDGTVTLFNANHLWMGNFFADGDRVFARIKKDPLLAALAVFDTVLLNYYAEIHNDIDELIKKATGPHHLFHQLTKSPKARLHLTKRLLETKK